VDRLFDEHVDGEVRPFVTHLPLYHLRAAAGRFGEEMDGEQEGWVRAPQGTKTGPDMFVARVVGRSMEPVIADGSLCVFRAGVTGSRQGRRVLVEELGEMDVASRYTVKRYTSRKSEDGDGSWRHERIRLEPLNPEYEAFDLSGDEFGTRFRVIAEFVEVLYS
jgi:phage repressor protein C with HTH and peptisase S24 domain